MPNQDSTNGKHSEVGTPQPGNGSADPTSDIKPLTVHTDSMSHRFGRATAWIVDYPVLAYLFLIGMSALAGVGYLAPHLVRDLFIHPPAPVEATTAPSASPAPAAPQPKPRPDVEAVELTRADAVLVIESDQIFTPAGAAALRRMIDTLDATPFIRSVMWMDRVPVLNIFGLREPLFPKSDASEARFAAARQKALEHPLVNGQLMSSDGRTLIVLVNFNWLEVTDDADTTTQLRKIAEQALSQSSEAQFTVRVTGRVPISLTMMQTHERNNVKFRLIGYGVVLVMSAVLFRGVVSMIILALGPALGIFWTGGFLNFFNLNDNPFVDVVLPVMLSLVGLADGVHMMVQIRRLRATGMAEQDATRAGLEEVGLACFLTAITTSIGFASLSLAQHEIVREFGWACVLGVLLTVMSILTVIPLAYLSWPAKFLRGIFSRKIFGICLEPTRQQEGFIEQHLHRVTGFVDLVLRRPKPVAWAGIVITVICALIGLQLKPDERRSSFLPEYAEATKALHQMDQALGGLEVSEVQIRWNPEIQADSPEVLGVIKQVDELLKQESLLGKSISIRSLLDALPGDSPTEERGSMIELLPPPLKRAFYEPEQRYATVSFRVRDIGIAQYNTVFQRVEQGLTEIAHDHPDFTLNLAGSAVNRWRNLYRIAVDLGSSLGSETIVIIGILAVVFRSFRLGMIAMIPNIFPLVVCATWMVFTHQPLEIVSVCSFTICLGIAVDDTIHYLTRYREELPRSANRKEAIRNAFQAVGTSMLMTTLVLVTGFTTVTFSDMQDQRIFATMGVLTMLTAMIGDLIILPALLATFSPPGNAENIHQSELMEQSGPPAVAKETASVMIVTNS